MTTRIANTVLIEDVESAFTPAKTESDSKRDALIREIVEFKGQEEATFLDFLRIRIAIGDRLKQLKAHVGHGNWLNELPRVGYDERVARGYMKLPGSSVDEIRIKNPDLAAILPNCLLKLEVLASLDYEQLKRFIVEEGLDMTLDVMRFARNKILGRKEIITEAAQDYADEEVDHACSRSDDVDRGAPPIAKDRKGPARRKRRKHVRSAQRAVDRDSVASGVYPQQALRLEDSDAPVVDQLQDTDSDENIRQPWNERESLAVPNSPVRLAVKITARELAQETAQAVKDRVQGPYFEEYRAAGVSADALYYAVLTQLSAEVAKAQPPCPMGTTSSLGYPSETKVGA